MPEVEIAGSARRGAAIGAAPCRGTRSCSTPPAAAVWGAGFRVSGGR